MKSDYMKLHKTSIHYLFKSSTVVSHESKRECLFNILVTLNPLFSCDSYKGLQVR